MAKLRAMKPHTYGGKTIEKDEEYEVDDMYANTLVSLGRAMRIDDQGEPITKVGATTREGNYQTRDMKAEGQRQGSTKPIDQGPGNSDGKPGGGNENQGNQGQGQGGQGNQPAKPGGQPGTPAQQPAAPAAPATPASGPKPAPKA